MTGGLTVRRLPYVAVLAIALTAVGACAASAQMYSDADLKAKLERVRAGLVATVEVDIPTLVDPPDKVKLQTLKADLPLHGRKPLDLHSIGNKIVIPVATLQFVDDLATLKAWLDKHQCDSNELLFPNYLHHLTNTKETRPKGPLAAFGLRRAELLRDPFVDDVSLKYYNSSVWFLIAHEIGHVAHGHKSLPDKDDMIAQEQKADAFAIKVLRRGRLNPAGVYLYFLATSFDESLNEQSAHPTSEERIRAVALELKRAPGDFVALKSEAPSRDAEAVLRIADNVNRIADRLGIIQARRKGIENDSGVSKLKSVDAEVLPKLDYTRACPQGRKS